MPPKKAKAAADSDLDNLFEGLGDTSKAPPKTSSSKKAESAQAQSEKDLLAELENLGQAPAPSSRPHTPRLPQNKAATAATTTAQSSPKRNIDTPQSSSTRTSEEKPSASRKSGESARSVHTSITPSATSSDQPEFEKKSPGSVLTSNAGGWWGSLVATATAAAKTAEAAVKEIQHNQEAQRWAEQVKGNVGALRGLGGELSSRALPTLTNILQTIAPPISSHERLQIHITHDFIGYPSLDPLIYQVFSRVMSQVEGGDLLVLQRGHESTARRASDAGYRGHGTAGWNDGPWWRQAGEHRDMGCVKGLLEGTKLVRVSAESYSNEYFAAHGGLDLAMKRATEDLSESNPVRSSDIFLAIQAIIHDAETDLFQGSTKDKNQDAVVEDDKPEEMMTFAIYLIDQVHSIIFSTLTQSVPAKWIKWLDAPSPMTPASSTSPGASEKPQSGFFGKDGEAFPQHIPEDIADIIESGGVDPREWVAEWVEQVLTTGTGVVAQRYVARRMGVGEGGLGKGKARMEAVMEDGGGEAARAGLI